MSSPSQNESPIYFAVTGKAGQTDPVALSYDPNQLVTLKIQSRNGSRLMGVMACQLDVGDTIVVEGEELTIINITSHIEGVATVRTTPIPPAAPVVEPVVETETPAQEGFAGDEPLAAEQAITDAMAAMADHADIMAMVKRMPNLVGIIGALLVKDVRFLDALQDGLYRREAHVQEYNRRVNQEMFLRAQVELSQVEAPHHGLMALKTGAEHPTRAGKVSYFARMNREDHGPGGEHIQVPFWAEMEEGAELPGSLITAMNGDEIEANKNYYIAVMNPSPEMLASIQREVSEEIHAESAHAQPAGAADAADPGSAH